MGLIFLGLDMDHGHHVVGVKMHHHDVSTFFAEKHYHHGGRVITAFPGPDGDPLLEAAQKHDVAVSVERVRSQHLAAERAMEEGGSVQHPNSTSSELLQASSTGQSVDRKFYDTLDASNRDLGYLSRELRMLAEFGLLYSRACALTTPAAELLKANESENGCIMVAMDLVRQYSNPEKHRFLANNNAGMWFWNCVLEAYRYFFAPDATVLEYLNNTRIRVAELTQNTATPVYTSVPAKNISGSTSGLSGANMGHVPASLSVFPFETVSFARQMAIAGYAMLETSNSRSCQKRLFNFL